MGPAMRQARRLSLSFDAPPNQVGQYVAGRHTERETLPRGTQQRVSQSAAMEHSRAQLMLASIVVQTEP